MSELRWDPTRREWVVTATHRQGRTHKPPEDFCPFCPANDGEFVGDIEAEDFDVVVLENRFPSLQPDPPTPAVEGSDLFAVREAEGACEVVVFTPEHDAVMSEQPVSKFRKLVSVWRDRYRELGAEDDHDYVFVFENKGAEVGVTLDHPHGQIYAYPFVPPVIERELAASEAHREETGRCLFCDVLHEERADGRRVVLENESFTAVVPFYARYAYEVHVYANDHLPSLDDFGPQEEADLAELLHALLGKFDSLFGFEFPYNMVTHQQPTDGTGGDCSHFHVEFYPPYRTAEKLKYLAGSERGAGTYINNKTAEEAARELRESGDGRVTL